MLAKVIPRAELTAAQRAKNKQMIRIQPEINWSRTGMRNLTRVIIAIFCLCVLLPQAQAASKAKSKATQSGKERLVLMPLRLDEADQKLQGAMETALVEGLQRQYEVLSGEQVARKAREIFQKESRNTSKKECDETRCLQGITEAFQSELLAIASVTKQDGGYFLALSIRNLYDNIDVYSKSLPCRGCDSFQAVDKIKELVGVPAPAPESPQTKVNSNDPDAALWAEVQKGNSADDYQVYIDTYPKGKYLPLAKARIKKLREETQAVTEQQEQQAWSDAQQSASQESYNTYLSVYPKGRFAALAQARISKLQKEETDAEAKQRRERLAEEVRQKQGAAEATRQAAAQNKKVEDAAKAEAAQAELSTWNTAIQSDTEAAYNAYLKQYPTGPHAVLAKSKAKKALDAAIEKIAPEIAANMVRIPGKNYEMGKYEVTQKEWQAVMGNNPSHFKDCSDTCPVEQVRWADIQVFLQKLNGKTGRQYRLPTEVEWEYACYGGSQTEYCGSEDVNVVAWNYGNSNKTPHLVGQKQANGYGLYDMSGNVWEWMNDCWEGDCAKRALRGGSWDGSPYYVSAAKRDWFGAADMNNISGFRLARTLP